MLARFHPSRSILVSLAVCALALAGCGTRPLSPAGSVHHAQETPAPAEQGAEPDVPIEAGAPAALPAGNLDPIVQILLPRPTQFLFALVPPTLTVSWEATDPDARSRRPLEFRYLLIDETDASFTTYLVNPDSLLSRYAPGFEEWVPVRGGHSEVELRDLVRNRRYLFVVEALDEFGGYDHVLSLSRNMLMFVPTFENTLGPLVRVTGDVTYAPPAGGLLDDPATAPHFQVPMDRASTLQWTAQAPGNDELNGQRWALDPTKLTVGQPGNGRDGGWSGWSLTESSAAVGPFDAPGEHLFYIEVRTRIGTLTRLLLRLEAVAPGPARIPASE